MMLFTENITLLEMKLKLKFIQEAIAAGENEQTAQGEDPLTEIEKEEITRKS